MRTLAGSVCLKVSDSIESAFIEVVYMGECFMACIIQKCVIQILVSKPARQSLADDMRP